MKCPSCNKDISDKAKFCGFCGTKINGNEVLKSTNQAPVTRQTESSKNVARCPRCGSTSLTVEKKGFSYGKAAAGVVLTGGIGLLAGGIGANKQFVICMKCGHKFKI